jgi:hypothetical protein
VRQIKQSVLLLHFITNLTGQGSDLCALSVIGHQDIDNHMTALIRQAKWHIDSVLPDEN